MKYSPVPIDERQTVYSASRITRYLRWIALFLLLGLSVTLRRFPTIMLDAAWENLDVLPQEALGGILSPWLAAYDKGTLLLANGTNAIKSLSKMPYIGNGYLATVIGSGVLHVGGLYDSVANAMGDAPHRVTIPTYVQFVVRDAVLAGCALDLERAFFACRYFAGSDRMVMVEQVQYAHREHAHLLVHSVRIVNHNLESSRELCLDPQEGEHGSDTFFETSRDYVVRSIGCDRGTCTVAALMKTSETPKRPRVAISYTYRESESSCLVVPAGKTVLKRRHFVIHTSLDEQLSFKDDRTAITDDVAVITQVNKDEYDRLLLISDEDLLNSHVQQWHNLWQSHIEVSSPSINRLIRSSLYYIISSLRADYVTGLSSGSLATDAHHSHSFWDTETWMFPPISLLYPSLARCLLQYRCNTLDSARAKARSYSPPYDGLMYAWESSLTSEESTNRQHHISAEVALAFMHHFYLTHDFVWLRSTALPIIAGIADFWISRVYPEPDGTFSIRLVAPPDEYVHNVNNSAYTNAAVQLALAFAVEATEAAGDIPPARWSRVRDGIRVPYDSNLDIHPEFDGYTGDGFIKQADAVLLAYPLEFPMGESTRVNNLRYYEPRTDPLGPGKTWSAHAVAWASQPGYDEEVGRMFEKSMEYVEGEYLVWRETAEGGADHFITGAGGFLQAVVFGFAGLRVERDQIAVRPWYLPPGCEWIAVRGVMYDGIRFDILVEAESVAVEIVGVEVLDDEFRENRLCIASEGVIKDKGRGVRGCIGMGEQARFERHPFVMWVV